MNKSVSEDTQNDGEFFWWRGLEVETASSKIVFDVIVKLFNIKTLQKKQERIKWFGELNFSLKIAVALDHMVEN